jgi:CRP-like cAMP-binding protein
MKNLAIGKLLEALAHLSPISEGFVAELSEKVVVETFIKNTEIAPKVISKSSIYFVASGLIKGNYFNQQGREIVTGFWWEKMFVITKQNSIHESEHLFFVEDTILISISSFDVERLVKQFCEARRLAQAVYLIERRRLRERGDIVVLPANEAYSMFQERFPAARIKLRDIANFLGITPYTLSRIRNAR